MSQVDEAKVYPKKHSAIFAGSTAAAMGILDVAAHLGPTGLVVGGIAAYVAWRHGPELVEQIRGVLPALPEPAEPLPDQPGQRSKSDRALGRNPDVDQGKEATTEDEVFHLEYAEQPLPCSRLQMAALLAHLDRNGYRIYLGRSVLLRGNPARSVNILKQHLKLIGASQKGKSSMAACILEQIIRSHDLKHALISILDLENRTGTLFEHDPHIVTFHMGGKDVKMHARSKEQVLEYLGYIVQLLDWRYTQPVAAIPDMPLLVVYIEEFLALKDFYKRRISFAVAREAKEQAQCDYDALIYGMSELARRGLKVRIQLLLCAQVDYRDEDLYEALANITAGMSFCVKPSAAQAAGFTDADLLKRNHKDNVVGQAVAEFSGCKDLILAPDFPLEQLLIDRDEQGRPNDGGTPGTPHVFSPQGSFSYRQDDRNDEGDEQGRPGKEDVPANVRTFPNQSETPLVERSDDASQDRSNPYRFTEVEIPQFLAAWRASGNVDKACQALHKSASRYRAHAKEILSAYNARQA